MNPINLMKARLETAEKKYERIYASYGKLLNDSIKLENKCEEFSSAVEKLCEGCAIKGTGECSTCSCYGVATTYSLWRELE